MVQNDTRIRVKFFMIIDKVGQGPSRKTDTTPLTPATPFAALERPLDSTILSAEF
jgi:hypothetical protein